MSEGGSDQALEKSVSKPITGEKAVGPDQRPHISYWHNRFNELQKAGTVDRVRIMTVGNSIWQEVGFGESLKGNDNQQYRGYLMVEPAKFPLALAILAKTAEERKARGITTEFKWLLKTEDPDWIDKATKNAWKPKEIGEYPHLKPEDPRIALYADTPQDILNILNALAQNPQWKTIEEDRAKTSEGKAPRRPGTNSFIDPSGHEWRSLNYNNKPGYSEWEVKNPNWRGLKVGTPTGNL